MLEKSVEKIRSYTQAHTELRSATHFSFDVCPFQSKPPVDVAIFGINQAEYCTDRKERENRGMILEDHSGGSFRACDEANAARWYRTVQSYIGHERSFVLGEFFFWSSKNTGASFRDRYGDFKKSPHLQFCRDRNLELLSYYKPRLVIGVGLRYSPKIAELYNLTEVRPPLVMNGKRIALFYTDALRPWFFSRHWTGAFGTSRADRDAFRECVSRALNT